MANGTGEENDLIVFSLSNSLAFSSIPMNLLDLSTLYSVAHTVNPLYGESLHNDIRLITE